MHSWQQSSTCLSLVSCCSTCSPHTTISLTITWTPCPEKNGTLSLWDWNNTEKSCSRRMNSNTVNFPFYSQARLTFPVGVMQCASYSFNFALVDLFLQNWEASNQGLGNNNAMSPWVQFKIHFSASNFNEVCQSSCVRHSLLVLKGNVRQVKFFSQNLALLFCKHSSNGLFQVVSAQFSNSRKRSPLVRRTTKLTFLLPWTRTWCLSMPRIFTVLLFCAHHLYLFFRSLRRPSHRNRFFQCKLISSLNSLISYT